MSNTTIQLKFSEVTGNTPNTLANGELAINTFDGKIFYSDPVGTIKSIQNFPGPSGLNTEIQFNDDGNLGANSEFTYDKSNSRLSVVTTRINSVSDIVSASAQTNTTNSTVLYSFSSLVYGTGKFLVQATEGTKRQVAEILVLHDGTTPYATEYAIIRTDGNLFNLEVDISSNNVRLKTTSTSSNTTVYKIYGNLLLL
jgi:hypothetical protein